MKTLSILSILGFFISLSALAQEKVSPSFEEIISMQGVNNPQISPDGKHVVFQKSSTDWKENRYDTELWLTVDGSEPFQLTNNPDGGFFSPAWSPAGKWISFRSGRSGKTQVFVIRPTGGEPFQVTHEDEAVFNYQWSPSGDRIAFMKSKDDSEEKDKRKDKYGAYAVEDAEYTFNQLWIFDFDASMLGHSPLPEQMEDSVYKASRKAVLHMDSVDFTITRYRWSPDGKKIAFNHQPDPLINSWFHSDISIYDIESETYNVLVNNPGSDGLIDWSPDGNSILFDSDLDDTTSNYYRNGKLFRMDVDGKNQKQLGTDWDEWISGAQWNESGIFASGWQKSKRVMIKINEKNGKVSRLELPVDRLSSFSFTDDGKKLAFSGQNEDGLTEIYVDTYPAGD